MIILEYECVCLGTAQGSTQHCVCLVRGRRTSCLLRAELCHKLSTECSFVWAAAVEISLMSCGGHDNVFTECKISA